MQGKVQYFTISYSNILSVLATQQFMMLFLHAIKMLFACLHIEEYFVNMICVSYHDDV